MEICQSAVIDLEEKLSDSDRSDLNCAFWSHRIWPTVKSAGPFNIGKVPAWKELVHAITFKRDCPCSPLDASHFIRVQGELISGAFIGQLLSLPPPEKTMPEHAPIKPAVPEA